MAAPIRLQKLLAEHGIASRRRAEGLIAAGQVRVNGAVVQQLGTCVDPACDRIEVDGQLLSDQPPLRYLLLHKPVGWLSTCFDPRGRRTVMDLLPLAWRTGQGLHPVGRLDYDSSGALLISSDGALTFRMTHPSFHLPKTYRVWLAGHPGATTLERWRAGVLLEGQKTLPASVQVCERTNNSTLVEIILVEGRNRQIRKVAEFLGYPVQQLHRIAIGPIVLGNLPAGHFRELSENEIQQLQATGTSDL
ncbi:pseudouridine synthase [Gloeobacter kilaueensis]|uniref:Pseudouridine synthase n=1 Tax=Gloeobacter kilaueensis (strain ATCC BAA-2537 / CCAP 1431/1 / ULC 316 / JS1) TaxID=1183438 RepID=U5QCR1_GLOK1|nr:pseudouridine synthase [Gloeobacter kilaueensis]AGY56666.1 pseudouridine synthase [Gloeobacter kilaueensis JS1]